jgi:hypothetical protein
MIRRICGSAVREPLLHFLLAGAALFGAYAWMNRSADLAAPAAEQQIRIGTDEVAWLAATWAAQQGRPPTQQEIRELVTDYVNEQLLARAAVALGLDDNDVIVRRRLAQKMRFLLEDTWTDAHPSETELRAFYRDHPETFASDPSISFEHLYYNAEHRPRALEDATDALKMLRADLPLPARLQGDRLLVEGQFRDQTEQAVSAAFGPAFAREVFRLAPAAWSGPVQSGYGIHLVRVSKLTEAQPRAFENVRAAVAEAWRGEQERAAKARYLAELRTKYGVVIEGDLGALVASAAGATMAQP